MKYVHKDPNASGVPGEEKETFKEFSLFFPANAKAYHVAVVTNVVASATVDLLLCIFLYRKQVLQKIRGVAVDSAAIATTPGFYCTKS